MPVNSSNGYDRYYFQNACGKPYERNPEWLQFFAGIASAIVSRIAPHTVLDAGCAMGFLVEGLRACGVDAFGIDVSEYALGQVRPDLKPYVRLASVLDPLSQKYDLIVSIEVLEHLSLQDCERAVENLCQASDDVLFSSTPADYREPTHLNVQPPEFWAGLFARQGFFRDVDFDASFITPWAARFRRNREPFYRVAQNYERRFWLLWKENQDLRGLISEMRNQLAVQVESTAQRKTQQSDVKVTGAQPAMPKPVLIISHEMVGDQMAGPGIRYYHLAGVLSKEFPVTLAVPVGSTVASSSDFSVLVYRSGRDPVLENAVRGARLVLAPAIWVSAIPSLVQTTAPLVIDGYDPFLAETLHLQTETSAHLLALTQAYMVGDFFLCASERQRDWWLGLLEASGRINRYTYDEDPSLRRLVDLVPFGLPQAPPLHTHDVVRGIWSGIGKNDRIILWGGGLWQWLDPLTAIRAIAQIWQTRQDIRLIFPGTQHPNPIMAGVPTRSEAARKLASELGLVDKAVFFGDWVSYENWQNVLLESDIALTLHDSENFESRLAFRSRILDYVWAGLPTIATRGDSTSELLTQYGIGFAVDCQDVEGVASAILQLLDTPRAAFDKGFERARESLTWQKAARPLVEFCRNPRRAPDKIFIGEQLGTASRKNEIVQLQSEVNQLRALVGAYQRRWIVRLADGIQRLVARPGS